eukprot:COSAG01_NODE_3916_length_5541_cov_12.214994_6_plen_119_part_00
MAATVVTIMLVLVLRSSREGTHSASGSCAPSTRAKYVGVYRGRFHLGIGSILAEIYLCHACSDQEIEDGNARPAVRGARRERPEHIWVPGACHPLLRAERLAHRRCAGVSIVYAVHFD